MKPAVFSARVQVRQFSDVMGIPTDKEQQWGRRKEEMDAEAAGDIAFDHEASIVPAADCGTKENPIMVCDCLDQVAPVEAISPLLPVILCFSQITERRACDTFTATCAVWMMDVACECWRMHVNLTFLLFLFFTSLSSSLPSHSSPTTTLLYLRTHLPMCLQVPSGMHHRTVGYEDPATHQLLWFNLDEGALHFVPDINLYFKLQPVGGH